MNKIYFQKILDSNSIIYCLTFLLSKHLCVQHVFIGGFCNSLLKMHQHGEKKKSKAYILHV